ncbi:MAG: enoyl-CoA hydratase-related protein, partial [Planctomycetota bacterium]
AKTIASRAPVALRLAMEAINRGQNMSQKDGEIMECDMFGLASTTKDMKEGMAAFLEKRKATFVGQ